MSDPTLRQRCEQAAEEFCCKQGLLSDDDIGRVADDIEALAVTYARERVRAIYEVKQTVPNRGSMRPRWIVTGVRTGGLMAILSAGHQDEAEANAALDRLVNAVVPGPGGT